MLNIQDSRCYLSEECINLYNELFESPALTADKNYELFKKWHTTNNNECRDELILGNIKLVYKLSQKHLYPDYIYDADDRLQYGILALIRAVDTYDYNKGYAFTSYAVRVIENRFKLGWRRMKYVNLLISLDTPISYEDTDDCYLIDTIPDPSTNIEEDAQHAALSELVSEFLNILSDRDQQIMKMRFGFDEQPAKTQVEIANIIQLDQSTISRIIIKSLEKLKYELLKDI